MGEPFAAMGEPFAGGKFPRLWLCGAATVGLLGVVAAHSARLCARAASAAALAESRLDLAKLAVRLLADPLPEAAADIVYLFHQLDSNLESTVAAAVLLLKKYPTMRLLVLDVRNDKLAVPIPNGFSGGPLLLEQLQANGIPRSQLEVVAWDHGRDRMIHTLIEAELAVRQAKARSWHSMVVVAPPFHLVRAAITAASVALREFPELRIYPFAGTPLPWEEVSVHSQGMKGRRLDFLQAEMERIERYMAKGDIAPLGDLVQRFVRTP